MDERTRLVCGQLGNEIPALAVAGQVVVEMLHPDDGHVFAAGLRDERVDAGGHAVAVRHDDGSYVSHRPDGTPITNPA